MLIGVQQGSILEPWLFSIYINDFPKTCPKLNCIIHYDNTILYVFLENVDSNDIERGKIYKLEK